VADIDPADQWVLDPETGRYELRLDGALPAPPADPHAPPPAVPPVPPPASTPAPRAPFPPFPRGPRPPAGPGRPRPRRGSHRAPRRLTRVWQALPDRRTVLMWAASALGLVLFAGGMSGYLLYRHLNDNIRTVDVGDAGSKSVAATGPLNILFIGTDSRVGLGRRYGDADSPGHADTTILFHLSADRSSAIALSIPRDLVTDIPDCPTRLPDGTVRTIPGTRGARFNASLGQQGRDPGCTMRTVEALTGIRPDHFMMADFGAVKELSTAVGGVEVCLGKDIDDAGGSGLRLSRGRHLVSGEQALAFVRTRHSVGDGSDLDRIKLQQQFLASLVRSVTSRGTLTDPAKLWALAQDATKALTVDTGIGTVARLSDLARQLEPLTPHDVTFATLPVTDNPAETQVHSTVVLDTGPARQLFRLIAADQRLDDPGTAGSGAAADPASGPRAAPGAVSVSVFNGSGVFGSARLTVAWLRDIHGVTGALVGGNAPLRTDHSTLRYAPEQADQARELADLLGLPSDALTPDDRAAPGAPMTLTLGDDFVRPGQPLRTDGPSAAPPTGLQAVRASDPEACAK
jgi:LCP family protein required for cell wall assembly